MRPLPPCWSSTSVLTEFNLWPNWEYRKFYIDIIIFDIVDKAFFLNLLKNRIFSRGQLGPFWLTSFGRLSAGCLPTAEVAVATIVKITNLMAPSEARSQIELSRIWIRDLVAMNPTFYHCVMRPDLTLLRTHFLSTDQINFGFLFNQIRTACMHTISWSVNFTLY